MTKVIGMIYRGCTITRTETTTDTPHGIRKVYAIEGAVDKPAAQRPFITSIRAAKEYIRDRHKQDRLNSLRAMTWPKPVVNIE